LGDLGVDVRIILKYLKEILYKNVDWIHLAQDRVLMIMVINIWAS
jgi:hypothetical protein